MIDTNYVENIQQLSDFFAVNGGAIITGFASGLIIAFRKEIKRNYRIIRGDLLPNKINISDIKTPIARKIVMPSNHLKRLKNNECYSEIKAFNDVLETNFNSDELANYYNNINQVDIYRVSKLDRLLLKRKKIEGQYTSTKNTIQLVNNDSIYHELFHMASTNDYNFMGFLQRGVGISLNEGYTEFMRQKYFPRSSSNTYHIHVYIAKQLDRIVGKEKMEKLYLTSDLKGLVKELSQYASTDDIMHFIENGDYALLLEESNNNTTLNKFKTKKAHLKEITNYVIALKDIEDFLTTCLENKMIIEFKEKGEFDYLSENDVHLILKLRRMDMTDPINNNRLNKNLIHSLKQRYSISPDMLPVYSPLLSNIEASIGYEEIEEAYLENGFQGIIDEMKKYISEEDITKLIADYQHLYGDSNTPKNEEEVDRKIKELNRLLLTYDLRKEIINQDKFDSYLLEERIYNIIVNYLRTYFPTKCNSETFTLTIEYSEEEVKRIIDEIHNEFSNEEKIQEVLEMINLTPCDILFDNKLDYQSKEEKAIKKFIIGKD